MSRAREFADLAGSVDAGGITGRNLIINGAMQVWQRGTSQTASGSYAADRFWMASASSASRSTDVPSGFLYSTKLTYSASTMSIGQPVELVATGSSSPMVSGESVTLSFYAKVDSGTEDFAVGIHFRDAKFSATNQSSFTAVGGTTLTATTSWQRFTKTFTIPSVNGTNVLAGLEIGNIDKDFYITGVQLEVGSQATPFEHRSYGDELARCQRYYYKTDVIGTGIGNGSTSVGFRTQFIVPMRAVPTVSAAGTSWEISDDYIADATASTPTVLATYNSSNTSWRGQYGGFSGITVGRFYSYRPSSASIVAFDAEL